MKFKNPTPTDLETLKAWCHWKRKESDLSESDRDFVKAIEDLISQVGTYRAKLEKAEKQVAVLRAGLGYYAKGKQKRSEIPGDRFEFGCGCCVGTIDAHGGLDYDSGVIGRTAQEALSEADRFRDEK